MSPTCNNPPHKNKNTALIDSAASISLLTNEADAKLATIQEPTKILSQPDGAQMETTKTLEMLMPKWPPAARKAFRTPKVTNNLVAVSELCDAGCGVYFQKTGVEVDYEGEIITRGWRERFNRLWRIPITSEGDDRIIPTTDPKEVYPGDSIIFSAEVNAIYECENLEQLTKYFHAALCSHPKSTLIAAANEGYLRGCPGFTAAAIRRFIGVEVATECGHMRQIQQGTRSTTTKSNRGRPSKTAREEEIQAAAEDAMSTPAQEPRNEKTHIVFMTTVEKEGLVASDQTGAFPQISNRGNRYMCIFYIYDCNHIKGVPIKSRKKEELLRAYKEVYKYCEERGYKPKLHKLDNETSRDVESFIRSEQAQFQYTPPDMHRTNPAERAIQTWKSCMKSCMASLPPNFPMAYWCRLSDQVNFAVNIVRKCLRNPLLSAWAAMEGEYHFDATPIAPPGSEMMIHEKPNRRRTWSHNAKKAWYIGPCPHHYRNMKGILQATGTERKSDTVRFLHHAIAVPQLTPADRILEAARDLNDAIRQQPKQAPLEERTAIEILREVLLGEKKEVPPNSVQRHREAQRQAVANTPAQETTSTELPQEESDAAYVSDDEDEPPRQHSEGALV